MFNTLNAQQQPYIQSGYGALGKLNTLLGIGGGAPPMPMAGNPQPGLPSPRPQVSPYSPYRPAPGGGIRMQPSIGPGPQSFPPNVQLSRILALRAANGDTEAQRMLGSV